VSSCDPFAAPGVERKMEGRDGTGDGLPLAVESFG